MSIQLTAYNYKNLNYKVTPQNIIDTITVAPITNVYEQESSVLATESVTSISINGTDYSLSNLEHGGSQVSSFDNEAPTYRRCVNNEGTYVLAHRILAKARTDVLMYSGSKIFTTTTPISGQISATLSMTWKSSAKDKDASISFDDSPSLSQLNSDTYSLATWIRQNSVAKNSGNWIFNQTDFSTNPWAKPNAASIDAQKIDVITKWYSDALIQPPAQPAIICWSENSNYALSGNKFTYINDLEDGEGLSMTDDSISISCTCKKLDNYRVRVSYTIPVRFSYFALARSWRLVGGYEQNGSWAFVDRLVGLEIQLNGLALDTTKNEMSYSLDENQELTTNLKNNFNYKLENNELFTLSTYKDTTDNLWSTYITKELLTKYEKGKIVATLDVPVQWAIENNIHINSEVQVQKQDTTYITRKGTIVTFLVKAITKKFTGTSFEYSLSLMEE